MKKIISFLIICITIASLTLFGCGNKSFAGTYSFRMGKYGEKHFAISLTLTEDDYVYGDTTYGKNFDITFDVMSMFMEEGEQTFEPEITALLENGITIHGYYNLGEETEKGTEIEFGLCFAKMIQDLDIEYATIIRLFLEGSSLQEFLSGFSFDIDGDILRYVILAYATGNSVDMILPVSLDDLIFQLYWYGIDINKETFEIKETPEGNKGEIGSRPTKEDIIRINETYPTTHFEVVETGEVDEFGEPETYNEEILYREFYTINLGLLKE